MRDLRSRVSYHRLKSVPLDLFRLHGGHPFLNDCNSWGTPGIPGGPSPALCLQVMVGSADHRSLLYEWLLGVSLTMTFAR